MTWARDGKKRIVWRCVSRLEFGTKYYHASPARCLPVQGAFCHFVKSVQKISAFANLILLLPDIFI
jgi:hypothetical protein